MENLIQVLSEECTEYETLLGLSMKKTPIIVRGELKELQEITDEEQNVVGRIQHLEKQRTEIIGDIANVLNKDVENLKLIQLIQLMEDRPQERQRLASLHDKLTEVTQQMGMVNERNKELIRNALELVEFDITVLQSLRGAPETAKYTKGAYTAGEKISVRSASFDTKQ